MHIEKSLKEIQDYVCQTAKERGFDKLSPEKRCLMLGEEIGELFKAVRKSEKIKVAKDSTAGELGDELADVLLQLCAVANYYKIDLTGVFYKKDECQNKRF